MTLATIKIISPYAHALLSTIPTKILTRLGVVGIKLERELILYENHYQLSIINADSKTTINLVEMKPDAHTVLSFNMDNELSIYTSNEVLNHIEDIKNGIDTLVMYETIIFNLVDTYIDMVKEAVDKERTHGDN